MNKAEKNFIYVSLIIIILLTSILIIKEQNKPKYDEKLYAEVYKEYNEVFQTADNDASVKLNNKVEDNDKYQIRRISAVLEIDKLHMFYPILKDTNMENLKIAPTKLCGSDANEIGNFCIVGHNYHSDEHFSRLQELEINDNVKLTSNSGNKVNYRIYDIYEIEPDNLSCLSQNTNGKRELTLITCTNDSARRLVVKCVET